MVNPLLPRQKRYAKAIKPGRPEYTWPEGKRLAVWFAMNIEVFAFGEGVSPDAVSTTSPPTLRNFAWRDYGNRVGIWNLFDLFDDLGIPMSCLTNSLIYDEYPEIVARMRERGDPVVGHGRTNAENARGMWEGDEQAMIAEATTTIEKHEGRPPKGWLGPGAIESPVSPDLLKEAGYTYVLDWPCDDTPVWLDTRAGKILSVPYPFELNDIGQIVWRQHTAREFADMMVDQFEELLRQSEERPVVYCCSLHTYIAGQPFRLTPIRKAMKHIVEHPERDKVWYTSSDAIADYCYELEPGLIP